jgi:hypothetical protein
MAGIKEVGTDELKKILTNLALEYFTKTFKLTDNYKNLFDEQIKSYQKECDNLRANGQSCDKEENFLENMKKVIDTFEKNNGAVKKDKLEKSIAEDDLYLYTLLLNLEKQGIIQKN